MNVYKVVNTCEIFGSQYDAGGYVGLSEEQERQLKVGKFAEEVPDKKALARDPNSKAKVKIGNKNLVKARQSEIEGLDGKALESGAILYPPVGKPVLHGETPGAGLHPTQFQNVR
jgi:hypothetical protein